MNIFGRGIVRTYTVTGVLAIVAGGVLSAFFAKQPSTFAMWASAYLVLIVGIAQIFLGGVIAKLGRKGKERLAYTVFGLFNVGNALVIGSTAIKYAELGGNIPLTIVGSVLFVAALVLLGWHVHGAKPSQLKVWTYIVITALALSTPVGLFLAHQ